MEPKKSTKADYSKKTGFFFSIGLVVALSFVLMGFEWKTYYEQNLVTCGFDSFAEDFPVLPIIHIPTPPPPPKRIVIIPVPEELESIEVEKVPELENPTIIPPPVIHVVETAPVEEVVEIVDIADVAARPDEGFTAFYRQVKKALHYPSYARRIGVEGKVFVQFVVETDGQLTQIQVIKGIGAGCDEEALRVIKNSARWNPARLGGRKVRQRIVLPIHFKLN